ncbi:DUF1007 family protein [Desulfocurvus sp. DL9XJH121]
MQRVRFLAFRWLPLFAAALFSFFHCTPALAHPHVFVDNDVCFVFSDQGLSGVRVRWVFDDMFGTMILEDFDKDGDHDFSRAEIAAVKAGAFDNLKNFDYFTFVEVDGAVRRVSEVRDFRVGLIHARLFYEFFVPCEVPAAGGGHTVLLSVHDPEYYADVYTPEEAKPGLERAGAFDTQVRVRLNSDKLYSPFQVWTPEITLTFAPR